LCKFFLCKDLQGRTERTVFCPFRPRYEITGQNLVFIAGLGYISFMPALLDIPIGSIKPPITYMRPVLVNSLEFLQLTDSIRSYGIMNSILVRPDGEDYQLVDGAWRLAASAAAGQETIPAICKEIPDDLVHTYQLITNATRKPTKPIEFARHIERIRRSHGEDMDIQELAILIRRSPKWIMDMLQLIKLSPEIKLLVNRGEIPLGSAHALSRLPYALRHQVLQEARIKTVSDFTKLCGRLLKLYREEVKKRSNGGRMPVQGELIGRPGRRLPTTSEGRPG